MARNTVQVTPMYRYERQAPDTPYLGWGRWAIRKVNNVVKSPRLKKINDCMAREVGGQEYKNLREVQEAFLTARKGPCKI